MFKKFSLPDLAVIAILLDEEEEDLLKKPRRLKPAHKQLRPKRADGEFYAIYKGLIDNEIKFRRYFGLSKYQFNDLLSKIEPLITKKNTSFREAIRPIEKLAVCLRFLLAGDSSRTIAVNYKLGFSTVRGIIHEVCKAVIKKMKDEQIPVPSENDWKKIADKFWEIWNFPNCIGALEGKSIQIKAPYGLQHYEKISIILLALVDSTGKFTFVDVQSSDKYNDGGIFANSNLKRILENKNMCIPSPRVLPGTDQLLPYVIIGDKCFPLKTYLLRPYPESQIKEDKAKAYFNSCLFHAHTVVNNAFDRFVRRFQIYHIEMRSKPEYVNIIVLTTCILHNYIMDFKTKKQYRKPMHIATFKKIPRQGGGAQSGAYEVRDAFKHFFNLSQMSGGK